MSAGGSMRWSRRPAAEARSWGRRAGHGRGGGGGVPRRLRGGNLDGAVEAEENAYVA
jgi:hypothetical protein